MKAFREQAVVKSLGKVQYACVCVWCCPSHRIPLEEEILHGFSGR